LWNFQVKIGKFDRMRQTLTPQYNKKMSFKHRLSEEWFSIYSPLKMKENAQSVNLELKSWTLQI
jgi:hypothetical protein